MILYPDPPGWVAIPQAAHALLAFTVAEHWGNRETPRPTCRSELLAAVMLHDAGWDEREEPPRLGPDGVPLAFDTWPEEEREELWTAAVARAALRGRYATYLVSHHVSMLASRYAKRPHAEFLAAEEKRRGALRAELEADARFAQVFRGVGDDVDRAIVRLTDAIAVHLSRGMRGTSELAEVPRRGGPAAVEMRRVGDLTYRLRPWPLVGRRLELGADGVVLPAERFASEQELRRAWVQAPRRRLHFRLLAPGEPGPARRRHAVAGSPAD